MITKAASFRVAKSDEGRCDDALGTGGVPLAYAVADGLGSSPATSGYFAQEAADWYVRDPSASLQELMAPPAGEVAEPTGLAARWMRAVHTLGKYLDNPAASFESAGCTLAGVHVLPDARPAPKLTGLVIGDSAVFIITKNEWEGVNNLGPLSLQVARSDSDMPTPNCLGVSFGNKRIHTAKPPEKFSLDLKDEETTVVLATDALAVWLHHRLLSHGQGDPAVQELLAIKSESEFVEWTLRQRYEGMLELDDVAMVRLTLLPATAFSPAASNEAAKSATEPPVAEERPIADNPQPVSEVADPPKEGSGEPAAAVLGEVPDLTVPTSTKTFVVIALIILAILVFIALQTSEHPGGLYGR